MAQTAAAIYKRATDAIGVEAVERLLARPITEAHEAYSNAHFNFDDAGAAAYKDVITLKMLGACSEPSRPEPPPPDLDLSALTSLQTQTPAEIDEALSQLWQSYYHTQDQLDACKHTIASYEKCLAKKASEPYGYLTYSSYTDEHLEELRVDAGLLLNELADTLERMKPYNHEYARRGHWNRYFLVLNGNGHVHRGMNCQTCYPTTRYAWLTTLSDCDEAAMVAQYGHVACSVCFPDAPVERLRAERDAATYCQGSGKDGVTVAGSWRLYYGTCPDCGKRMRLTKAGVVPKHKKAG